MCAELLLPLCLFVNTKYQSNGHSDKSGGYSPTSSSSSSSSSSTSSSSAMAGGVSSMMGGHGPTHTSTSITSTANHTQSLPRSRSKLLNALPSTSPRSSQISSSGSGGGHGSGYGVNGGGDGVDGSGNRPFKVKSNRKNHPLETSPGSYAASGTGTGASNGGVENGGSNSGGGSSGGGGGGGGGNNGNGNHPSNDRVSSHHTGNRPPSPCPYSLVDIEAVFADVLMPYWGAPQVQSTHPINTPSQHILSIHPINTPYQHTLSTHPINTPCQYTLSIHPLNTPSQHILSIHPLNQLFLPSSFFLSFFLSFLFFFLSFVQCKESRLVLEHVVTATIQCILLLSVRHIFNRRQDGRPIPKPYVGRTVLTKNTNTSPTNITVNPTSLLWYGTAHPYFLT